MYIVQSVQCKYAWVRYNLHRSSCPARYSANTPRDTLYTG